MTQGISLRLRDEQEERVQRLARRMNRTISETPATLIEEGLRMAEFAFIRFRDSAMGRQVYILGSSLAVWEIVALARAYHNDSSRTAQHLEWPEVKVQAALNYAADYPEEIEAAIADNVVSLEQLSRLLSGTQRFVAAGTSSATATLTTNDGASRSDEATP